VEGHIGLGRAYLALAKLDAALEALEAAFALDANRYDVYYNRGVVYSKQGNYDGAIADFQKVLEFRSDDSGAFFEIGFAYQQQGQYEQAIHAYQKAIEINPDDAVVHHNLARCYVRQGDRKAAEKERKITKALQEYEDKIDHARAYINQYSDKAEGYAYLASIYYQRNKWELAIEQYNLAIAIDPHFTPAYRNLAELYIQQRNLDQAVVVYQKALQQNPVDVETRVMLALLYKEQSRMRKAMEQLNFAQELLESSRSENGSEHLEMLSFVYYAKGSYDKAEAALEKLMKLDPNNSQYRRQLSTIRSARQREKVRKK
jgi:tetratricopeptide (TPR) repeat protein